jgi:hypothetical protein
MSHSFGFVCRRANHFSRTAGATGWQFMEASLCEKNIDTSQFSKKGILRGTCKAAAQMLWTNEGLSRGGVF